MRFSLFHNLQFHKGFKAVSIILLFVLNSCSVTHSTQDIKKQINQQINNWHLAAAHADEDFFFSQFAKNGIYIGTDPTELWTAQELKEWSKTYFDRDTAWDFKPIERHIYLSKNKKVAWFNELLNTWMGVCRGSGVLEMEGGKWKIQQYHLSVSIPNDKMEEYLKLFQ